MSDIKNIKMYLEKLSLLIITGLFLNALTTVSYIDKKYEPTKIPWLAIIFKLQNKDGYEANLSASCPGALIHLQAVLTTAACLYINLNKTYKNLTVKADNQSRHVLQVKFQYKPQNKSQLINNYALLKLSDPFLQSLELNVITVASVTEFYPIKKCKQLNYYGKSLENAEKSKIIIRSVKFSKNNFCNSAMYGMYSIYYGLSKFLHSPIECNTDEINIKSCIYLQDWSAIVTCSNNLKSNSYILTGFISTFVENNFCTFAYHNVNQASRWIIDQIESFFND